MKENRNLKVVITGGPGGGKTTAIDLLKRELHSSLVVVPEVASLVFSSGITRSSSGRPLREIQKAIYHLQLNMEDIQSCSNPSKLLLCDRGSLDGIAYWERGELDFYNHMNTSFESEVSRYDAIIFFETAAASGDEISSNNPYRNETNDKAIEIDNKLREIWSKHDNFHLVSSTRSFIDKVATGVSTIQRVINEISTNR